MTNDNTPNESKKKKKLFVIKKYVLANYAAQALKLEREIAPDDCWVDEDWRKQQNEANLEGSHNIGFNTPKT